MSDHPQVHIVLKLCRCDLCGVAYAIPAEMFDHRVAWRATVCCPNGHVRMLGVEPPHERRIQQLEQLVAEHGALLVAANEENRQLRRTIVDRLVGPDTAPDPAQ